MWRHCNFTLPIRLEPAKNDIKFSEVTVSCMKRMHFSILLLLVTLKRQPIVAWLQWPLSNFRYMYVDLAFIFIKCIVTVICVVHSSLSWHLNEAIVQIDKNIHTTVAET